MKKKAIWFFVFVGVLFTYSNLFAAIRLAADNYVPKEGGKQDSQLEKKPCQLRGYKYTTCPTGQIAQDHCPDNDRYFASCACDLNVYKYSNQNCDVETKVLSGSTCMSGEIKLYKNCSCKSSFKFCKEGAFHKSSACQDEEGEKYAICNEDIPSCESIGHLTNPPAGYQCQQISNEYMTCYIAGSCIKN